MSKTLLHLEGDKKADIMLEDCANPLVIILYNGTSDVIPKGYLREGKHLHENTSLWKQLGVSKIVGFSDSSSFRCNGAI